VGDEDDAGERVLGEVVKDSVQYLVGNASEVGGGGCRHGDGNRESKNGTRRTARAYLG